VTRSDDPLAVRVVEALRRKGWTLATAESITGGQIAQRITSVPGASAIYTVGWITYATEQKTRQLAVPAGAIAQQGVVSAMVAGAMASGALNRSGADITLATTGVAGPDPLRQDGHPPVPVGRVFLALGRAAGTADDGEVRIHTEGHSFVGTRSEVQRQAADSALKLVLGALES
jgi:PncC family amidohydrolase